MAAVEAKGGVPASATNTTSGQQTQAQLPHAHHHHHHHHHHHAASGQNPGLVAAAGSAGGPIASTSTAAATVAHQTPSTPSLQSHRSKKEDHFLLSLPSQDHEAWYDHGDSSADDGDDENLSAVKVPRLSNRGNKLSSGAKFVRKGRLGGWENHEIFKSRSAFPANNVHTLTSGNATSSSKHHTDLAHRNLPGGYPIAPHITLVPSSSTAAARPDNTSSSGILHDLSNLPPSANSNGSFLSPRAKRRKHRLGAYTHDGLASTSSSFAAYSSGPVRAYLPAPPQTPVELVMSPLIGKTFSPRNRTLEKLSLGATELIEQDIPLVKALTRLIDFLRGNSIAGEQGVIGLPFIGDNDDLIGANARAEADRRNEPKANGHAEIGSGTGEEVNGSSVVESGPETKEATLVASVEGAQEGNPVEGSRKRTRSVSMADADKEEPPAKRVPADASAHSSEAPAPRLNVINGGETEKPAGENAQEQVEAAAGVNSNGIEGQDVEMKENGEAKQSTENGEQADIPIQMNGTATAEQDGTSTANGTAADNGTEAPAGQTNEQDLEQGPDSRSRSGSVSSSAGGNEDGQEHRPLVTARLAPSIQRIASPQSYIESLFVTPHDITVPIVAGAAPQAGMEGMSGAGGMDTIKLTPNEQLETVRLCLGELTKFLADSLEYQDRLGEIRDSVLGIERRRKGVWNMARGYAHQMLWEEEQDKLGNGV